MHPPRHLPGRDAAHLLPDFIASRHEKSTQARYKSSWSIYLRWCVASQYPPRSVDSVVLFIMCRSKAGVKYATIRTDLSAIYCFCPAAIDADRRLIAHALEAAKKSSVPTRRKRPITWSLLGHLYYFLRQSNAATWRRDWAFFLLGFLGMFRGAELTALRWTDLDFSNATGVAITLRRSKTDPYGEGAVVRLSTADQRRFCPVHALAHLQRSSTFVFPGPTGTQAISTDTMRSRLRDSLTSIHQVVPGPVADYGLHSLRRGGATAAAQQQVPVRLIMHHGRWRSDTVHLYTMADATELWGVSAALHRAARQ